jgi:hypothetical protein
VSFWPSAEVLAERFVTHMRESLTRAQLAEVDARNAVESDPGICHSHDFCDANVVMLAAWEDVGLKFDDDLAGEGDLNPKGAALWNEAWDLARARGFGKGG